MERSVAPDRMARRLRGAGLEIGALEAPQLLPFGAVTYVDVVTREEARRFYPEVSAAIPVVEPDVLVPADHLSGIADGSQDFVVASHVLEHLTDPLRALREWHRVLAPDGLLYLCLPDKRATFDRGRVRTTLDHLVEDHRIHGTPALEERNREHYVEWARVVNGLEDPAQAAFWAELLQSARYPIHFHCWIPDDVEQLLAWLAGEGARFEVEDRSAERGGYEFAFLLRARKGSSPAAGDASVPR